MILNRKTSLSLLIINFSYIVYHLTLTVLLKEHLIININRPPVRLPLQAWLVTQALTVLFFITTTTGLVLVLKKANERLFVLIAIALYFLMRLTFDVIAVLVATNVVSARYLGSEIVSIFTGTIFLFFIVSMFLVKNRSIRLYYIWFGVIIFATSALTPFSHVLYDSFGLTWALINPNVTKIFPFAVSLALFYSLYTSAKRQIS